jgi:hypothetical protein
VKRVASIRVFIADSIGAIMVMMGIFLLVVGVFALSMFGTVMSAVSLFAGSLMVFFGLFMQLGFFSKPLMSVNGLGTVLICASVAFLVFSVVVVEFVSITGTRLVAHNFHGVLSYEMVLATERPYVWISNLFLQAGLGSLGAGVALKVFNFFRNDFVR